MVALRLLCEKCKASPDGYCDAHRERMNGGDGFRLGDQSIPEGTADAVKAMLAAD